MQSFISGLNIKQSIRERKLKFSFDFLDHFNDLSTPFFFLLVTLFLLFQLFLNYESLKSIFIISTLIILSITLLVIVIKNLIKINDLIELKTSLKTHKNKEITIEIATSLGWSLLETSEDYFIFRNPSRMLNGGEIITIIFDSNLLLFNSTSCPIMNNAGANRSSLSFGANTRNLKKFVKKLNEKTHANKML